MLTTSRFQELLPEFTTVDADQLVQQNTASLVTFAENNGYLGLPEATQEVAQALHMACYLQSNGYFNTSLSGNPDTSRQVKKYKSYDDEIEFFQETSTSMLGNTSVNYCKLLSDILENQLGAVAVANSSCGCSVNNYYPIIQF